jgi:hypothetical protein
MLLSLSFNENASRKWKKGGGQEATTIALDGRMRAFFA